MSMEFTEFRRRSNPCPKPPLSTGNVKLFKLPPGGEFSRMKTLKVGRWTPKLHCRKFQKCPDTFERWLVALTATSTLN